MKTNLRRVQGSPELRFSRRINKHGRLMPGMKTRCHEYIGNKCGGGYGRFFFGNNLGKKKLVQAHRAAWFFKYGEWPKLDLLHRCDNPPCVRLNHLFEGTDLDNARDKAAKGRSSHCYGESNGRAVLTENEVRLIRKRNEDGTMTQAEQARDLDVPTAMISKVILRRSWKHLT